MEVRNPRLTPAREEFWSEDATFSLIEAWGKYYLDINRGNIRQKHWQEVSDAVNARHGGIGGKVCRSDVQCKNRMDTLKKKYKIEKARVSDSHGSYHSSWPFFDTLDSLMGSSSSGLKKAASSLFSPSVTLAMSANCLAGEEPAMAVPQKRPFPAAAEYANIRNNYSVVAAAAASAPETDDEEEEEREEERDLDESNAKLEAVEAVGLRNLARAIEGFSKIYATVEAGKQRQIVELEKQRMKFAKELEFQRMQMLVEMQVQLEKVKRVKR